MAKNELDSFLDGLKGEESEPFEAAEEAKEETAEEESKEEEKEEKPLPFNRDPKILKFIEKEVSKRVSREPEAKPEAKGADEADEILTRIIGNDTPEKQAAVRDFRKYLSGLEEKGAEKAMERLRQERDAAESRQKEAEEELESGLEGISERYGIDLISDTPKAEAVRKQFLAYVAKISPKDADGDVIAYADFDAAYEEFAERQKRSGSSSKAREIASRGMARSGDASERKPQADQSWRAVERAFGSMR